MDKVAQALMATITHETGVLTVAMPICRRLTKTPPNMQENMMNSERDRKIDYIEFNVKDIKAAKHFYGEAFGWAFIDYGPNYCEFSDGRLKGGFTTLAPVSAAGGPLVILFADNLEETLASVLQAGGKIVEEIFDFPGGRRFHFADQDGYVLAVWSDN